MEPIDIFAAPWNCVADSDWTPGNGTDNAPALEAAINYALANQCGIKPIEAGPLAIRLGRPVRCNWSAGKLDLVGVSQLQTSFFADFDSLVPVAAFMVDNPPGLRSYIGFENFNIFARHPELVSGIYCGWTGSFSHISRVLVEGCNHGFVIANDFAIKVRDCTAISSLGTGIRFGWTIDDLSGPCNNVTIEGGLFNTSGNNGISVTECRGLTITGAAAEANNGNNIYLNKVYGASLTGIYMEFDPALPATQNSQLYITNSEGISINGVSVSAFDLANNPIIWLDGNNRGVKIGGVCIESSAPGILNATGIRVVSSQGVKIEGNSVKGVVRGVTIDSTSEVDISSTPFTGVAVPVITADWTACKLNWTGATAAEKAASQFGLRSVVTYGGASSGPTPPITTGDFQSFRVEVFASDLNSGTRSKVIAPFASSGGRWRILDIKTVVLTAFAGGDRGMAIMNSVASPHKWTILPPGALAVTETHARWGDWKVPASDPYWHELQDTELGSDLVAVFNNGTGDHTAGRIIITVVAHRVE